MITTQMPAALRSPAQCHSAPVNPLAAPLTALLRELETVASTATSDQFTLRCGEQFFNATIGGHVRHCLDHVRALVDADETGCIDYDHRERGTDIESLVEAARLEIARLIRRTEQLASVDGAVPVRVTIKPTRDGPGVTVESSLGRELSFVLSHTIHHNAIVRSMAFAIGVRVPQTFGYAPSTLAHMDAHACAQ